MNDPVVYGADRVRRLRTALVVAVGLGALTGVIALLVATQVEEDGAGTYAVVLGIVSFGAILWSVISWRLLEVPTRTAKRAVILTGALLLLFALPTFQVIVGLFYVVLGLVLIFLAVIAEEGAAT
jgi:hypothetical protein